MSHNAKVAIALVLVLGIALLFILPAFDILPTAMRAWRTAQMIFAAIAACMVFAGLFRSATYSSVLLHGFKDRTGTPGREILDITSVQLC